MTDSDLIQQAQQGDEKAIVSLIAESLEAAKIVKYEIKNNFLKLIIEAEELPDREKLKASLQELITNSEINSIAKISLCGRKVGENFPEWSEVLVIDRDIKSIIRSEPNRNVKQKQHHVNDVKKEFIETLQTFKFSSVVPYQEVFNSDLYNSNI